MTTTLALSRIFAIYFIVVGLSLLINRRFFKAMLKDLVQSHIAMLLIAIITLILGAILITLHNQWENGWQIAVSVVCWITLAAGVVRTLLPTFIQSMASKILQQEWVFLVGGLTCLIAGATFGYGGFA